MCFVIHLLILHVIFTKYNYQLPTDNLVRSTKQLIFRLKKYIILVVYVMKRCEKVERGKYANK